MILDEMAQPLKRRESWVGKAVGTHPGEHPRLWSLLKNERNCSHPQKGTVDITLGLQSHIVF